MMMISSKSDQNLVKNYLKWKKKQEIRKCFVLQLQVTSLL